MPLTPKQRSELLRKSHTLSPSAVISLDSVEDAVVEHLRGCFQKHALIKVRVNADDGAATDGVGADLAARIPCELVKRIGKVLLLYRSVDEPLAGPGA